MHNYFVLFRTYESFLKLNPIIERFGFVFEAYNYHTLLSKFDRVISHGIELPDKENISSLFFTNPMFDFYTTGIRPMIFLRSIERIEDRMQITGQSLDEIYKDDNEFVRHLITTLRLYKYGLIELIMEFIYDEGSKRLHQFGFDKKHKRITEDEYIIEDKDIPALSQLLDEKVDVNELSKLAFDSFNLTYTIENKQLKYVTLMTALKACLIKGEIRFPTQFLGTFQYLFPTPKKSFLKIINQ